MKAKILHKSSTMISIDVFFGDVENAWDRETVSKQVDGEQYKKPYTPLENFPMLPAEFTLTSSTSYTAETFGKFQQRFGVMLRLALSLDTLIKSPKDLIEKELVIINRNICPEIVLRPKKDKGQ